MFITNTLIKNDSSIFVLGKEYNVKFEIRNFLAAKERYNLDYTDFISGIFNEDKEFLIKYIWTATLDFEKFTVSNPCKIKSEIDIDKLMKMPLNDLQIVCNKLFLEFCDTLFLNTNNEDRKISNSAKDTIIFDLDLLFYIFVAEMGFSEEFFYTSTLKTLFAILKAKREYSKILFGSREKAGDIRDLDKILE